MDWITIIIVLIIILILLGLSIRIVNQYERGVVFRVGKVIGVKEPGLRLIIPLSGSNGQSITSNRYHANTITENYNRRQRFN